MTEQATAPEQVSTTVRVENLLQDSNLSLAGGLNGVKDIPPGAVSEEIEHSKIADSLQYAIERGWARVVKAVDEVDAAAGALVEAVVDGAKDLVGQVESAFENIKEGVKATGEDRDLANTVADAEVAESAPIAKTETVEGSAAEAVVEPASSKKAKKA